MQRIYAGVEVPELRIETQGFSEKQLCELYDFLRQNGIAVERGDLHIRRKNPHQINTVINAVAEFAIQHAPAAGYFVVGQLSKELVDLLKRWFRKRKRGAKQELVLFGADGEVVKRFKQPKEKR